MASSHPYISGPGNIASMVLQLRKSFPQNVTAETVKKLGIASNNESYVINALHFVGIIDQDGKKTESAAAVFSKHSDEEFQKAFGEMVESAYSDLFSLHGEATWDLTRDELITFFRNSDQTSAAIGARQAGTFQVFSALSGHGDLPSKPKATGDGKKTATSKKTSATKGAKPEKGAGSNKQQNEPKGGDINNLEFGLSVKVEINLPSDASAETYDNIFKSIRKNLMNA